MKGMSSDSPISSNILLISRKISKILANFVKYLKTSKDDKATHLNSETNQNANQPKSIDSQEKTSANQHNSVNYSYENSSTVSIHLSEANKPSASTSSSSTLVLPTRIQTIQTPKESLKRRLFKSPPNSNSRQKCKQSFKQTTTLKEIESKPNIEASLSGIDDDDDDHKSEWNSMSTENNIKKSQENEYEQMGQLQPWPICEQYTRLRTQYVELSNEQARLRQRYDMMTLQIMNMERVSRSSILLLNLSSLV
ncbi:unnamed protein product [Trichobilharzia regenti]|nr:unnamed protein product [Trichobilharzia regenti]